MRKKGKQAKTPHLKDAPRGAAVDPQRLVQRSVERGAVATELSPELLLPLGVGERWRVASDPLYLGRVAGAVLTVYFGAPSMFITLWFGFDYGTNPPLGTLII
jgi:hypothetical protein